MEDSIPLILLMSGILYLTYPKSYENNNYFPEYVGKSGSDSKLNTAIKKVSGMIIKEEREYLKELAKSIKFYDDSVKLGFDEFDRITANDNAKKLNNFVKMPYKGVKSIIFYGPPGTGKTEAAKLICRKRNMHMISIKDDILSGRPFEYLPRLNTLKLLSAELRPCMIFMDEMDGMFKSRTYTSDAAANVASAGATNYMLNMINDLNDSAKDKPPPVEKDLFIVGATNHIDRVDKAMVSRMVIQLKIEREPEGIKSTVDKMLEDCPGLSVYLSSFVIKNTDVYNYINNIGKYYRPHAELLIDDDVYMYDYCKEIRNNAIKNDVENYYLLVKKGNKIGANEKKKIIIDHMLTKFKEDFIVEMARKDDKMNKNKDEMTGYQILLFLIDKKRIHGRNLENKLNMLCMYLSSGLKLDLENIVKNGNFFGKRKRSKRKSKKSKRTYKKSRKSRKKNK